jgi:hypothetical protein
MKNGKGTREAPYTRTNAGRNTIKTWMNILPWMRHHKRALTGKKLPLNKETEGGPVKNLGAALILFVK